MDKCTCQLSSLREFIANQQTDIVFNRTHHKSHKTDQIINRQNFEWE